MLTEGGVNMTLREAIEGREYVILDVLTDDEELDNFLFSLGCYSGETITVISHLKKSCMVSIKDARYNIDSNLARAITIQNS
jgi:ferrous iron transport protein A